MKIVIDTNVLINGFKDDYSYEKKIIDEVINGNIEAFANKQTFQENKLLLSKIIKSDDYRKQLNDFFAQAGSVINKRRIRAVRDPEDNKILESAVEAKADYLITSDNDLLTMTKYQNVKIVTPGQFWVKYKDEGMDLWRKWTNFISNGK
ncbi:MAG: putative toxin-antitoxin system toxin component, PIN family [Candidatus Doudnabacteria bacterium CG10_big_fil_rev_8_21_14_0_10_42_18]|uniref:Putative toxin-antitoxin system toxin component, PIN family n=1 Tax=Candidatus Doudnabacteria bacterium CG10_big_fil_rev_8_21_14_0_10_42_18 TaxID=1974552 RepID=A0A2H0VDD5_9BACT|nr:MAG: putative toxin-antitoxin system toxin component, PIN family [Candidatus Doudnabacteria bacterium CG10_big_fil_rev_8_21_14_0_10_42_18]